MADMTISNEAMVLIGGMMIVCGLMIYFFEINEPIDKK